MMERNRIIGWIAAHSKQETIDALEQMRKDMELCDDDVDWVNMAIGTDDLKIAISNLFIFIKSILKIQKKINIPFYYYKIYIFLNFKIFS